MSGKLDITIEQGTTFSRVVTIKDDQNNPIDLQNDSFQGQIRKHPKQDLVEADFEITILPTTGQINIKITHTATSAMTPGRNYYDIEWTRTDGSVLRILEGVVTVTPEVTR